jgi:hypothetical protein
MQLEGVAKVFELAHTDSRFPIPGSRFPVSDSRLPVPGFRFKFSLYCNGFESSQAVRNDEVKAKI